LANYTAEDVKKLREATAAGMLDCKKALDEADGDYAKALDLIRVKGLKGVTKREGRLTSNGAVVAKVEGNLGVMLELTVKQTSLQRVSASLHLLMSFLHIYKMHNLTQLKLSWLQPWQMAALFQQ